MKQQNFAIKFKNKFIFHESMKQTLSDPIITKDTLKTVTISQLNSLIELYTRNTFQNGFNHTLAFRVIILYCYSTPDVQQTKLKTFQLQNQLKRFLNNHLNYKHLQTIQQCLDLLMIDEVRKKLPIHKIKLFKIKVLSQLNKHYLFSKKSIQRKKSTTTLRQLCIESLKIEKIKHNGEIYEEILDLLIQLQLRQCQIKMKKKKKFQALDMINNVIKYIENSQSSLLKSIKYQQKLMQAYWYCAYLHYQLHYIGYTKKYCQIVINIAQRLSNIQFKQSAEQLLQKVIL